jgi:signal transduction histidine kinase/ligand-binding sensor domain-containing protein/DNA-binding NarL/FixJ family response regulator/HPt (histidine-containing phosphotransfer) domain-containing protein
MSMISTGGSPAAFPGKVCRLAAVLLALVLAVGAQAMEQRPLVLRHLESGPKGLPQATVMTTLRDSQGFVWLGTEDGLVRFDAQKLVRYADSPDAPNPLPGIHIWQVIEDANHDLWVAVSTGGVARWRRSADRFEVFQHIAGNPDSLASNATRTLLADRNGRIWIGTLDKGVDILDPATGRVQHLRHDAQAEASLSSDTVYTLRQDRSGDIWIGTEAGLDRWHRDSGRIERMGAKTREPLLRTSVSQVIEAADGTFWVGTYNEGLARIDRDGRILRRERHGGSQDSLVSNKVRALLLDAAGNLWVGTEEGLDLLEPAAAGFQHYRRDDGDNTTLRDSYIMSLYQDPTGLIWIGTRGGGVSRWNPRSWEMGGARPRWLREQQVMAFADAPGRDVWIASVAGLFRYDSISGTATSIDTVLGHANALGDTSVMSLKEGHDGSLWIGTRSAGLKRLRQDRSLQSFAVAADQPRALSAPGIMSIAESRSGRIWVGTFGGGVNIVDPASGEIRQLPFGADRKDAVSGASVTAILEDSQGNFWLGTHGEGLTLVDAEGRLLRAFHWDSDNPDSLPSDVIWSLALDSKGRVWIGTDKGVARTVDGGAAPDRQALTVVSLATDQSSRVAWGVIADPRGGIWISGNTGLTHFDPASGVARVYHREDGAQHEEFTNGAIARLADGRLCFGGTGGFNIFDPQRLSGAVEPPALLLTGATVLGEGVADEVPTWARASLPLGYRDSIASVEFAVLDFAAPEYSRLSYRLSAFTDQWIDIGAQRNVPLSGLPAGDHVLEVRAASANSPWSAPLRFSVHRAAHPLLTPWAYGAYALLLGFAVALRIRHQRRKFRDIERARDHLEAQVKERTVELVESNRQLEEAARAKSDFLDRMSHELRTPMNGVVGMTELLSRTSLSATQTHLTKTIRSSAQILLQIVNDLLDLSKIRAGKVQLEALPVDIGQVLEECTSLFAGAAENKGLELIVCPPRGMQRELRGDPLRVRQVLMNLVGNAVKFTAQGEIVVRADVEELAGDNVMVKLSVSDTGIGMEESVLAKIFEPFTQADEKTTRQFGGTGLGLSICRELAELMGGRIAVESRQQIGSTFTLHLPMQLGAELAPQPQLPVVGARLCTRRPSLAEALQRHCAALGVTLAWEPQGQDREPRPGELLLVDAGSCEPLLARCLTRPELCRDSLVVIATPAEVERLGLRLLLPERAVVLKPVHHVAVLEALATVLHMPELIQAPAAQQDLQTLQGHVLLVEDDPVNAAVAQGYLAELGCSSAWVTSAEGAIARRQTEHFDLVFMDLNMADMDGFTATAHIRERERAGQRVPIVALTAHDAHSYRERVLAAGMDDILSKPYSLQDCRAMLARWITRTASGPDQAQPAAAVAPANAPVEAPATLEALASVDTGAVQSLRGLGAGGPEALYGRLAGLFESSSQPVMAALDAALRNGELPQAADLCHRLKSSAANVGAMAFAAALRELEQHCRAGENMRAKELHQRLVAAFPELLATLRSRRMAVSA